MGNIVLYKWETSTYINIQMKNLTKRLIVYTTLRKSFDNEYKKNKINGHIEKLNRLCSKFYMCQTKTLK